jgi:CsoR family transcriptional regulator, copper-sensing transcriptional repressor
LENSPVHKKPLQGNAQFFLANWRKTQTQDPFMATTSSPRTATRKTTPKVPAAAPAASSASTYRSEHQRDVINRLKRIEGQVRGLIDMVEQGRPCEDVAQQMSAARKAMDKAFYRMMACSVMEAVSDSDKGGDTLREVERSTRILERYA